MANMVKPNENEMAIAVLKQEKERQSLIQLAVEQAVDAREAISSRDLTYENDCEIKDKMIEFFRTLDKICNE